MKTLIKIMCVLVASVMAATSYDAFAAEKNMSLATARAQMTKAIDSAAVMKEVMSQLSPENQRAFLAEVNAAIAAYPGSQEEITAKFVQANRAAVSVAKSNIMPVLAETFATVPVESLVVLSEVFAEEVFSRSSSSSMSDAQYIKTAKKTIDAVMARTAGSDDAAVRNTAAVLMFDRATNSSIPDLTDQLTEKFDAPAKESARRDWIPAATGKNGAPTYEPMLSNSDAGEAAETDVVIRIAGSVLVEAMLADLAAEANKASFEGQINAPERKEPGTNSDVSTNPESADPTSPLNPDYHPDDLHGNLHVDPKNPSKPGDPDPRFEPKPY